ncbi:putative 1,4-dihydroxy-2-naphthoyl-CoA hydrolase [Lupinus albus]|uniref:Putative 1,4-dihydroxy-2-naphthoyl-CoA hydrolase n=1 Tax=Lupinus albus TaxID=3870 RepID=A0A6A4QSW1_LUPAL|nr:putative 1,4-dihydroxy-2-naphthoyl-CoA hydrolase [Lupinus albus]
MTYFYLFIYPVILVFEQVWEVQLWKNDLSKSKDRIVTSSSTVTLICNRPIPEHSKADAEKLKNMFAKL